MTNKLKIKLTREQVLEMQKTECSPNYCNHDFITEVDESQIVREKSNTFQRGERVEVSMNGEDWYERLFLAMLTESPFNKNKCVCVELFNEAQFINDEMYSTKLWRYIRKTQQPKKTVLKAPAIMKGGWLSNNLFETPAEAQAYYRDESDYSFPATIRMKDGSDQELWFVCEEE